jgi:Uncharacterised nucleotidyltransferase
VTAQSTEARLLFACIDVSATRAQRDAQILQLAQQQLDWNRLSKMVGNHRLTPIVYPVLELKPALDYIPAPTLIALKAGFLSNAFRTMPYAGELVRLMNIFETSGIRALTFKGPALSMIAHGDVSKRQYVDLDILVHREDLTRAAEVLIADGYQPRTFDREAFESGFFHNTSDEFGKPAAGCRVDLHWQLSDWYFPFGPDEDRLWPRTENVRIGDGDVRTLGAADHLMFLCAHGSKHGWPDLASVADIAALIRARPQVDLRALIEEATRLGCRRIVLVGLGLANRLARAALPEEVVATIAGDAHANALCTRIASRMLASEGEATTMFQSYRVAIGTIERPLYRIRFLSSLGLMPTGGDHARLRLPRVLYPLYYLVRPFRLVELAAGMLADRARHRRNRDGSHGNGNAESA